MRTRRLRCSMIPPLLLGCVLVVATPTLGTTAPGSLELTLQAGDFWEFLWTTESVDFVQGSGTTTRLDSDVFRIELGAPVQIAGQQAFPLIVTGETDDDEVSFAPRFTHLAAAGDGSLLGSTDGATLQVIYSSLGAWLGGGFFLEIPSVEAMIAKRATFEGHFNTLPAIEVAREDAGGQCVYYPSVNQTVCPGDDSYTIQEQEYYKEGVGPLGLVQFFQFISNGGGFTTSNTDTRVVELVGSSLMPADGSKISPPPWTEVAPLQVGRDRHAAVVLDGKIYAIGGLDGSTPLSSVEVYDPAADEWTFGTDLPEPVFGHRAEVLDGKIYVVRSSSAPLLEYDPQLDMWTERAALDYTGAQGTCALSDDTSEWIGVLRPVGSWPSFEVGVHLYRQSTNEWLFGTSLPLSFESRHFAVACHGNDMYLVGGYEYSLLGGWSVSARTLLYDAETGVWNTSLPAALNVARYDHAAVGWLGKIVVLGGWDGSSELRDVEAFDPAGGQWELLPPMRKPRQEFSSVVLDGRIYAIGGDLGPDSLTEVEVYDVVTLLRDGFESGDLSAWSSSSP